MNNVEDRRYGLPRRRQLFPCARNRLLECAAVDGQELDTRSGAGAARSARVRRLRDRPIQEKLLKRARTWGLTNRRAKPLTLQAIGVLLRNQLYAGVVDVSEYGVRGKRGDFEPLISEELFYRVQAILSGRVRAQRRASERIPTGRARRSVDDAALTCTSRPTALENAIRLLEPSRRGDIGETANGEAVGSVEESGESCAENDGPS